MNYIFYRSRDVFELKDRTFCFISSPLVKIALNSFLMSLHPTFYTDDYNRVVLETLPGIPDSDYINASYIDVSLFSNIPFMAQNR